MFTRRGLLVVGVLIGIVLMAYQFDGRTLNAVFVPGVVALVAGLVYVRRLDRPTFERRVPEDGFPETTREVEVRFDADGSVPATVEDTVGDGLSSSTNRANATIGPGATFSYEITYCDRGKWSLGPLQATVTDLFGFTSRTFSFGRTDSITVYPPIQSLSPRLRTNLHQLAQSAKGQQREEFARLREYNRGDSLRDVHWKSSAKRAQSDLIVKEFTSEETLGTITIAAHTLDDRDDELATVAASIVVFLLDSGFAVGLTTVDGRIDPATGSQHRAALLELLATVEPGTLPDGSVEDAALSIHTPADGSEPVLTFGDQSVPVDGVGDDALLDVAVEQSIAAPDSDRQEVTVA